MTTEYDSALNNIHSEMKSVIGTNVLLPTLDDSTPLKTCSTTSKAWTMAKIYGPYGAIPIVLLILLAILRPQFILNSEEDEIGETVYTISIKKLLIWTLVLAAPMIVGLYMYINKQTT